ncbi:MAG: inorganic pyrophosphatase [Anaerolineae bacterium]|nr:inorganic pyrophosphatase [Anaerolineae bacterium]
MIAVIEIPKGSNAKFEFKGGFFRLARFTTEAYPLDYGFFPGTLADDGDPLDVLVFSFRKLATGDTIRVRPVGVLMMVDRGNRDNKVLAVLDGDPVYHEIKDVADVPPEILRRISQFYHAMGKRDVQGWQDRDAAERVIMMLKKKVY